MPYEDLGAWFTDDLLPGWTRYWSEAPAAPPKPPWYRNSRVLLAMITAAAATLVVATALLVTLSSADFNQTRELRSINPAPIEPAIETAPIAAPPAPEAQAETEAEPPAAADPTASADAPPPPPAPRVVDSNNSDGPRMNVTRAPMSFTPGQIPAS